MDYKPFIPKATLNGNFNTFQETVKQNNLIWLITGKRGSGKSSLAFRLLENLSQIKKKKAVVYSFPCDLPKEIEKVNDIELLPNNAVILIDEGALNFSSRNNFSKDNKLLTNLMIISRHKDQDLIICCQNSANIDINTIRQADVLIFKEPSLLQIKTERRQITKLFEKAKSYFKYGRTENKKWNYIISEEFEGVCCNTLASFWNEQISKAYGNMEYEMKEMIKNV